MQRCGEVFVAQEIVDALGHIEIIQDAVAPTCTTTGLSQGKYCDVCDEVLIAQEVVSMLPHSLFVPETTVENYVGQNDRTYPFLIGADGKITSTNKADNSTSTYTITAKHDFTLELLYLVSSEEDYDKLRISVTGTTKVSVS